MPWVISLRIGASLPRTTVRRLLGRYGEDAVALVAAAQSGELELIPGTPAVWAELRWAAHAEGVVHLDDLLLRRVRRGLLVPRGAMALLPRIRTICQSELGWDDARWQAEEERYLHLWQRHYGLPDRAAIPDWRALLDEARDRRVMEARKRTIERRRRGATVAALAVGLAGLAVSYWRREHTA